MNIDLITNNVEILVSWFFGISWLESIFSSTVGGGNIFIIFFFESLMFWCSSWCLIISGRSGETNEEENKEQDNSCNDENSQSWQIENQHWIVWSEWFEFNRLLFKTIPKFKFHTCYFQINFIITINQFSKIRVTPKNLLWILKNLHTMQSRMSKHSWWGMKQIQNRSKFSKQPSIEKPILGGILHVI